MINSVEELEAIVYLEPISLEGTLEIDEIVGDIDDYNIEGEISTGEIVSGEMTTEYTLEGDIYNQTNLEGEAHISTVLNDIRESDVNFYDYDGTLLDSYMASDFLLLRKMPDIPTHVNLISEGWNWNYEEARQQVLNYGKLDVAQIYTTVDNKTKINITLQNGRLKPYLGIVLNGTVTVDWGDGEVEEISGTMNNPSYPNSEDIVYTPHIYDLEGNYTISLDCSETVVYLFGGDDYKSSLITGGGIADDTYRSTINSINLAKNIIISYNGLNGLTSVYNLSIANETLVDTYQSGHFRALEGLKFIGLPKSITNLTFNGCLSLENISLHNDILEIEDSAFIDCKTLKRIIIPYTTNKIGRYAFQRCTNLKEIILPNNIMSLGVQAFRECSSLKTITLNNNITNIPNYCFYQCYNLNSINIKGKLTQIGERAFMVCRVLNSIKIPGPGLTSIGTYGFDTCSGIRYFDFTECETIPTLGSRVFNSISSDAKIVVPDSLYDEWIVSGSWSDYANYIISASYFDINE